VEVREGWPRRRGENAGGEILIPPGETYESIMRFLPNLGPVHPAFFVPCYGRDLDTAWKLLDWMNEQALDSVRERFRKRVQDVGGLNCDRHSAMERIIDGALFAFGEAI
jgi:hypothetical protein